jgi:hypothetical protein
VFLWHIVFSGLGGLRFGRKVMIYVLIVGLALFFNNYPEPVYKPIYKTLDYKQSGNQWIKE